MRSWLRLSLFAWFCLSPVFPCLAGTLAATYSDLAKADRVDLSDLGSLDWALWGLGGPQAGSTTPDSRKADGGTPVGLIGPLAEINADAITDGGGWAFSPLWSWSGGSPNASGSDQRAALMSRGNGAGAGFLLTAPADTTVRSILIFVAGWNAEAEFTARVSDGSAGTYVNADFATGAFDRVGVFRVDYAADSAGQSLAIRWELTRDLGSAESVSISAVALTTPDRLDELPRYTNFSPPVNVAGVGGGGAISLAAGDLNNDGAVELVTTASSDSSQPHFRIYHREPATGAWSITNVLSPAAVDSRPNRFGGDSYLIDMNKDGWDDILLPESANGLGAGRVCWFENPRREDLGGLWSEHVIATWSGGGTVSAENYVRHMSEIYAGDIDADGDVDVVTRDVQYGLFILVNNGSNPALASSYTRRHVPVNPREGLALFDPDHDGDLDILINGAWFETPDDPVGGAYVRRLIKKSSDAWSPWYPAANNSATQNDYACKVFVADFNADGLDDVAITNSEELSSASSAVKPEGLWVYLAEDATGQTWREVVIRNYGLDLHNLHAGDIDLDGDLDLMTGISTVGIGNSPAEIFVYLNDGNGLDWEYQHVADVNIYSGILTDADADGDLDIVGPDNWNSGPLRLVEADAPDPLPVPGDANDDGHVDIQDFVILKQNYGSAAVGPDGGDFNGDGVVDIQDFVILKRNYGV